VKDLRLLAPILACCGVKLLLVGALFAPAGLLSGNVLLGIASLTVAVLLVALAVRSRKRCDGTCHAPAVGASGSTVRNSRSDRHPP
jgi:hypothetical protein